MKEYGKLENGILGKTIIAEECPEGMKEVIRDDIIPEDAQVIYVETDTTIRQTYQEVNE